MEYPAHDKLKRMSANSSYYDAVIAEFTQLQAKLSEAENQNALLRAKVYALELNSKYAVRESEFNNKEGE
jgi:hypothetical protein